MKKHLFGLEDYGLSPSAFARLGSASVRLTVTQRLPPLARLHPLTPAKRLQVLGTHLREGLRDIRAAWTGDPLAVQGGARLPWTLEGATSARNATAIARLAHVAFVFVDQIPGRKRVVKRRAPALFTVRGLVAIQVEDQASGYQTIEERFVLIRALSTDDACKRLARAWKEYADPGINSRGQLFRWQLEKIIDVYELIDTDIDLDGGAEVYSRLDKRPARKNPVWHPRGAT